MLSTIRIAATPNNIDALDPDKKVPKIDSKIIIYG